MVTRRSEINILAFFAHPDDETVMAGGTLALLARRGAQVHYLCATRGEGGETGEPPLCTIEELGPLRSAEIGCAVQALGGSSLAFLDYVDPRVGPGEELYPYTDDIEQLAAKVADQIRRCKAEVVITHGSNGEYGHPAHKLSHQATRVAIAMLGAEQPMLYTAQAFYPAHPRPRLANKDEPAHLVIDITPVLPQKITATLCHRTQHALFIRRRSAEVGRQLSVPEVVMDVESLHRALPPVDGELDDALSRLIRRYATNSSTL